MTETQIRFKSSRRCLLAMTVCLLTFGGVASILAEEAAVGSPEAIEQFERTVRPILAERCQSCHGSKTEWASLRLDSRAKILEGGESGPAIVAGNASLSELISRVSSDDPDIRMPPPGEGDPLSAAEIQALTHWIDQGAAWPASVDPASDPMQAAQDHWAFQPISNPAPPAVQDEAWIRQPVDRFILRRLESQGLKPSPPADRRTLIRRATYDLTGLPPTPDQVAQFVADRSDDAYPQLIERLLASPAYGEKWGRHWLDVARYSDTKGYVYGREDRFFVHSAIYRDWVVKAFNDDMPYDRFLLLQMAADQAAPEDPTAAAAMGFITLGRRFLGVLPDIIDDRIDVVTRGTMGLTVSCARCHDHKFDPIPTADYYSLYGVFHNSAEVTRPLRPAEEAAETPFEAELEKRKKALSDTMQATRAEFSDLARQRIDEYLAAQWELEKYPEQSFSQILSKADLLPSTVRRWQEYLDQAGQGGDPVFTPWTALAKLPREQFAAQAPAALAAVDLSAATTNPQVAEAFSTPPTSVEDLVQRYATLFRDVEARWQALLEEAKTQGSPLPTEMPDPADEQLRQVLYGLGSPCVIPDLPIVNIEFDVDTGTCVELWKLQSAVDQWILKDPTALPHAVILEDKPTITTPRIFRRGDPTNFGAEVPLRFLKLLSSPDREPFNEGSGRYEMAQAIVSPENPLTARVWVNRVWGHHFGEGLVRTPSDFGTRADAPSHPDLLDWLATQFIAAGWSTKSVHRQIMLSATYQQTSRGPEDQAAYTVAAEADPENRLLWRMNPRRLTFEELRDTYLAVSGDLDERAGGKGVELFASSAEGFRRTLYTIVDREYLPGVLRDFDFANPDLHTPQRSETTIPQQALFALNHRFVADRARSLAAKIQESDSDDLAARVTRLYQEILQRDPTPQQQELAVRFIENSEHEPVDLKAQTAALAWSYGYGEIDPESEKLRGFTPLPHFTGTAWQGAPDWPSTELGWAQITADGGHPGNTLKHAIVRRWTATTAGNYRIESTVTHSVAAGDGIRCWVFSSGKGMLAQAVVHNSSEPIAIDEVTLEAGETLDFVVDIFENLNSDQHLWAPQITRLSDPTETWNAQRDFTAELAQRLTPWQQLAQVLLISNELMFVD